MFQLPAQNLAKLCEKTQNLAKLFLFPVLDKLDRSSLTSLGRVSSAFVRGVAIYLSEAT
jgi:hypothetical protein